LPKFFLSQGVKSYTRPTPTVKTKTEKLERSHLGDRLPTAGVISIAILRSKVKVTVRVAYRVGHWGHT